MKILASSTLGKMKFFKKRDKRKESHAPADGGGRDTHRPATGSGHAHSRSHHNHPQYTQTMPGGREPQFRYMASPRSGRLLARLPDAILDRIFKLVCPHAADETYETCEQSATDDTCMLCDLRDLAHCVAVNKRWRDSARSRLYYSIRIDAVHYCEREWVLSEKRKRRSFFDRNGLPEDPAQARLKLLCRTLRDDPTRLGKLVFFFKTPYMLRESCQADLARTIAVLPNLRFVDLPEGLFMDEPAFLTLRLEVEARCRELRKMTYMAGAERSLEKAVVWPRLEVLELVRLNVDPALLRHVLGALHNLRAVKVSETESFDDDVLSPNDMLPPFPPLDEFILKDVPRVTAVGLRAYLAHPATRQSLRVLNLSSTGVKPWQLNDILGRATALSHLTIVDRVAASLPMAAGTHDIPPLRSTSLRTLNYEIMAAPSAGAFASSVTPSYYNYLSGSLLSGGLPNLRAVYVRDATFPDSLLGLPPPPPSTFADPFSMRRPSTAEGPSSPTSGASPRNYPPPGGGLPAAFVNMQISAGGGGANRHNPFQHRNQQHQPPQKPFAAGHNPRFSSNNPFAAMLPAQQLHTLEVFTKGDDELDWSFVKVSSEADELAALFGGGMGGGAGGGGPGPPEPSRPHSSYGLSSEGAAAWGASAGARKSVFMGNGAGGFLAVPGASTGGLGGGHHRAASGGGGSNGGLGGGWQPRDRRGSAVGLGGGGDDWPRPTSSAGDKRRDRMDLWR